MKVRPAIRGPKNYVNYSDLEYGDTFIYHNQLCMKIYDIEENQQIAIFLGSGSWEDQMCNEQVLPVDTVINWTKKKE